MLFQASFEGSQIVIGNTYIGRESVIYHIFKMTTLNLCHIFLFRHIIVLYCHFGLDIYIYCLILWLFIYIHILYYLHSLNAPQCYPCRHLSPSPRFHFYSRTRSHRNFTFPREFLQSPLRDVTRASLSLIITRFLVSVPVGIFCFYTNLVGTHSGTCLQ